MMYVAFFCMLLEFSLAATYLVSLTAQSENDPSQQLQEHLHELTSKLPHANILHAYYNLAEMGLPSYAVEVNETKLQLRELFPSIDDLEHTSYLHLTNKEFTEDEEDEDFGEDDMSGMRNIVNFIPYDTTDTISKIIDQPLLNKDAQCTIEYNAIEKYKYTIKQERRKMMRGQDAPVITTNSYFDYVLQIVLVFDTPTRVASTQLYPAATTPHTETASHGDSVAAVIRSIAAYADIYSIVVTEGTRKRSIRAPHLLAALDYAIGWWGDEGLPGLGVAVMPFVGSHSRIINRATDQLAKLMLVVTSAGDEERFVCHYSPASSNRAITAAATRSATNTIAHTSNFGDCIDVHAPGECLHDSEMCLSGSSLATSIVAGIAAQVMTHLSSQPKLVTSYNKLDLAEKLRFLRQLILTSSSSGSSVHELPYKSCSVPPLLLDASTTELTNTIANGIKAFITNRGARRIMDSVKKQMKMDTNINML